MAKATSTQKLKRILTADHQGISLTTIFQKLPGLIYIRDCQTQGIVWCNKCTEDTFGYTEEEIIRLGKSIFPTIIHPDDFYLAQSSSEYYQHHHENFGGVIRVRHKNSTDYKWLVGISKVFKKDKDGKALETLCVFLDFTAATHTQVQLSKALQEVISLQYKNLLDILSKREKEIIRLIVAGYSTREISQRLFISPHTVDGHRKNIRLKLNVDNTPQLVALAKNIGLE
jgi:DNA-binding CsgD family transcriptional regulator